MRPIAPLDLSGAVPADLTGLTQPDFDLVDPAELLVDDDYQRDLTPKSLALIQRIVEGFRWSRFKPPICVRVDGKLHVVDGQHSAIAAATHPQVSIIPVVVVDEPQAVDRAKAFVSHARDRLAATPGQIWRAEVAAGDDDALTILQVCDRAGVTLLPFAPGGSGFKPAETIALAAIKGLVSRRGAKRAREVLEACAKAELAPISGDMIKACEALLCEDEYRAEFDPERVALTVKALGPRATAEAKELAAAKSLPMWRALVATLFKQRKGKTPAAKPEPGIPGAPKSAELKASDIGMSISTAPRPLVRPPEPAGYIDDLPPPGRSALDQRRASA